MDDYDQVGIEEEQEEERTEEKIINEEYKTWKKNAPFLYDMILSTALEWPTLTTQWLPDKQALPDKPYSTHRLLIGTHTSSDAQNYLQIAHVQLPNPTAPDAEDYDDERGEIGGYGGGGSKKAPMEVKFNIVQKIDHKGEVNKARYQPQNPNVIATMCTDGRVMVWDRSKHPSLPTGNVSPELELLGHTKEGFGLSWSPHLVGHLVTGSEDKTVRLWDITQHTKGNKALRPSRTYTHHSSIVNDVQYHPLHSSLIGTVSDDITLQIIDDREADTTRAAAVSRDQHKDAINAIAFNPAKETVLATGSADKSVGIWDLRNLKSKLHALECHNESVTSLAWHPFEEAVLASASYDRKIMFWDLSRAGEEQTPEDAQDGPPELLFMHGGHTNRISDFSWNLNDPWVLCSAAEDNLLQVWKVSDAIVGKDMEDIPTEELET
ncbi:chromatin assembly factor 1 subunit C [Histoplasma capsulatum G186AR]|uniref:Histone acetyltransferase type B subunit 2 n=1 Tax=Ajellomyces capsulatus (strain G186AR / H82 / ATCC MYA-2454 / RMSCC 2432) TaxID=447093 RepID=C0NTH7_AJECG|nr:chromatin assembly factor 1 subunit C [Histoplasma capsulatum G186AR]EEH05338.1 chromatin assembly factor 1 subunit C [Histoplasma capsulatum G186AR]KAG5291621.1 chromatin assembly factor 1 subunit C [Histoplasma ohiense (nom. inval.)]